MKDEDYVQFAREKYAMPSDNDIEIDDEPVVSHGDNGTFVQAWLWVSDGDLDMGEE